MKRFLELLFLCYVPIFLYSQNSTLPNRVVENVSDGVLVTYDFPRPSIQTNSLIQGTSILRYNGFGVNDIQGEPAIPFRSDMFYIPNGFDTRVDVIETNYNDTALILSPSIPYCMKDEILTVVDSITPYHGFFPNSIIEYSALDDYRGAGLQRIVVMPVQYNYEQHIVRFYSRIKYKITFRSNTNNSRNENNDTHKIKDFLSKVTLNYSTFPSLLQREVNALEPDVKNFLIITTNNYLDSLQHFIEWKRIKGNRILLQSANRGEWTTDSIKHVIDSIHSLYPLDYVLMVGGFDDVPADSFSYTIGFKDYDAVTDYAYGLPSANLQIPQIHRGRIPVDNQHELNTIMDKIIEYERCPTKNDSFYKTALHCGEFSDYNDNLFEDVSFIQANENLREHLIHNFGLQIHRSYYYVNFIGQPKPTDILHWNNTVFGYGTALPDSIQPSVFGWNTNQVLSKMNEGCFYVLYIGHGGKNVWQAPSFGCSNVDALHNGDEQPVIFSIACLTGKYNENGDCLTEKFLKKENGGSVGIFAATGSAVGGYEEATAYGMFDAIWPGLQLAHDFMNYDSTLYTSFEKPFYDLGTVLDLGLLRMTETYGRFNTLNRSMITKKIHHYFGDPSMMIYTDVPQDFVEPTIKYVNGKICVQSPCDSTRITFYTPSPTNPIIDSFIGDSIEYETNADSVFICLDKHNYVPYVQTFHKNLYIQNETINGSRNYVGDNIFIGNHVTTEKPTGNVVIENAKVSIQGNSVNLHPGTRINHSSVIINSK